jgi:hypothetical protein
MDIESNNDERNLIHRWVNNWRDAGPELDVIRRREAASVPVHETIRQPFDGMGAVFAAPSPVTSGLMERQMWFTRIRTVRRNPAGPESNE